MKRYIQSIGIDLLVVLLGIVLFQGLFSLLALHPFIQFIDSTNIQQITSAEQLPPANILYSGMALVFVLPFLYVIVLFLLFGYSRVVLYNLLQKNTYNHKNYWKIMRKMLAGTFLIFIPGLIVLLLLAGLVRFIPWIWISTPITWALLAIFLIICGAYFFHARTHTAFNSFNKAFAVFRKKDALLKGILWFVIANSIVWLILSLTRLPDELWLFSSIITSVLIIGWLRVYVLDNLA